jgi:hypothetical protein
MQRTLMILLSLVLIISGCGTGATPPSTPTPGTPTPTLPPTATPFPTSTPIPTPVPGMLYVDPATSLGPISPLVYGTNYGPWLVVSLDMMPAVQDLGLTILRFPAGEWGDKNDVRGYLLDAFMDFTNKMGATLMFSVRMLDGNPAQAAAFVQYAKDKNYNIQYWSIGNEPTLYNAMMETRGETYDIDRFNKEWRVFAEAMKAVDPTIKLVGPEINQFSFSTSPGATTNFGPRDEEWLVEFLKANGDLVDVVSFHRYPFPATRTSGAPSFEELRANTQEWDKIIAHARELIHQHAGRDIPIAVTEFNSMYGTPSGGETTPDSHFNAIWMADVLGRMIKNGVVMANEWALATKGGSGGSGLVGQYEVLPAYYTYQMYKKFGTELVYSSSDDPNVSIYAARQADGTLTVMVINLSLEKQTKNIQLGDQTSVQAEAWLFDPDHKAENIGNVELSGKIEVPAQSVNLFIIR